MARSSGRKESACSVRDLGSISGSGRSPGEGDGREVQKGGDICIPMADSC